MKKFITNTCYFLSAFIVIVAMVALLAGCSGAPTDGSKADIKNTKNAVPADIYMTLEVIQ